jgi:hypothetical protein
MTDTLMQASQPQTSLTLLYAAVTIRMNVVTRRMGTDLMPWFCKLPAHR